MAARGHTTSGRRSRVAELMLVWAGFFEFLGMAGPTIEVGMCGIFNTGSLQYGIFSTASYAAKVAFDERFFDNVLKTTNFSINIHPVDTACTSVGVSQKVLPMLLGQGKTAGRLYSETEEPPVVALIGCTCSGSSTVVSQLASPLLVPMVSPSATALALSDKDAHPYFTRVMPPDSKQGAGLAKLIHDLGQMSADGWTRVTMIYPAREYSEGVVDAFTVQDAVSEFTIIKEPVAAVERFYGFTEKVYETMKEVLMRIAETDPFPRVLVLPGRGTDSHVLALMAELGLFSDKTALFTTEAFVAGAQETLQSVVETQAAFKNDPSSVTEEEAAFFETNFGGGTDWSAMLAKLHGIIGLLPSAEGPLLSDDSFKNFWAGLTKEKLYAAGYPTDYFLEDEWLEENGVLTHAYGPFCWDATVAVLVAIADMLAGGAQPEDVAGADLLSAILGASFEGLTGMVSMDASGDRLGSYSIINLLEDGQISVGEYDAIEDVITFSESPIFPSNSTTIPSDRPTACSPGYQSAGNDCEACEAGYFSPSAGSSCVSCPAGTFAATHSQSACETAVQGRYVAAEGSTESLPCPTGQYSSSVGAASCVECQAGFYASSEGSTSCLWCETGTYSENTGSSACQVCNTTRTTAEVGSTSSSACVCREGYYQPTTGTECLSCPSGLSCPLGSNMNQLNDEDGTFPTALVGYMTLASAPLQAYSCRVESYCPGGAPGICGVNRAGTSIACADCMDNCYPDGEDCRECSGGQDYVLFVVVTVISTMALVAGTYVISKDSLGQTHGAILCAVSLGLFFTGMQTLGVFDQLAVSWADPIKAVMKVAALFSFNLDVLKVSCIFGSDPVGHFALRILVPPCAVPILGAVTYFRKSRVAYLPQFVNNLGICISTFFISIVICCAIPFVCYSHPGGELWSMRSLPSVLCFQGPDFTTMASLGVIFFLFVPLPFMALSIYGVRMYPTLVRRHDTYELLQALRFLYVKFVPEAYFYAPIMLLRSVVISLIPVILTQAAAQILSLCILLLLFFGVQVWLRPWRGYFVNVADACITGLLIVLLLSGAMLADIGSSDDAILVVNVLVITIFILIFVGVIALAVHSYTSDRFHKYSKFICHHKASAAAQARLLKMNLAVGSQNVFIDSDNLSDLDLLFDIVKTKVHTLVVYLTQDTLRRPWCAGEITTAFSASQAKVLCIWLPSFVEPTLEEMQDLSTYVDETGCSLRQYAIAWDAVRDSFEFLLDPEITPRINMVNAPRSVRQYEQLADAVNKGYPCDLFGESSEKFPPIPGESDQIVVSADRMDEEAIAAAGIFVGKIQERLFHREGRNVVVCSLVEKDEEDQEQLANCVIKSRASIILLSPNSLQSSAQLCVILNATKWRSEFNQQARETRIATQEDTYGLVPLMLPGFNFPTDHFYKKVLPEYVQDGYEDSVKYVKALFKLIVTLFPTHASEDALDLEVDKVLTRIPAAKIGHSASNGKTKNTLESFRSFKVSNHASNAHQIEDETSADSDTEVRSQYSV